MATPRAVMGTSQARVGAHWAGPSDWTPDLDPQAGPPGGGGTTGLDESMSPTPQTIFLANAKSCIPFQVRRLMKTYNSVVTTRLTNLLTT